VPQPQESQPNAPQEASQEEEPIEIELVAHESPTDQDVEDKASEQYPPPSDTKDEKMYRDADEVESFGVDALVLTSKLWALLEHLGITTAPGYGIKEVPRLGPVEFKAIVEIFFGSRVLRRHNVTPTFHKNKILFTYECI
jgi:hypothetical protein